MRHLTTADTLTAYPLTLRALRYVLLPTALIPNANPPQPSEGGIRRGTVGLIPVFVDFDNTHESTPTYASELHKEVRTLYLEINFRIQETQQRCY